MFGALLGEKIYSCIQKSNIKDKRKMFYVLDSILHAFILCVILLIVLLVTESISAWTVCVLLGVSIVGGIVSAIMDGKVLFE